MRQGKLCAMGKSGGRNPVFRATSHKEGIMRLQLTTFNLQNLFSRYALLGIPWENRSFEKIVTATGLVTVAGRGDHIVSSRAVPLAGVGFATCSSKCEYKSWKHR
jgi:hypothetical protein